MTRACTLREALADPQLLGHALPGPTWEPWRALLLASQGEPLTDSELAHFQRLTGRTVAPLERADEFWVIAGRRAGKTRAESVLAAYTATLIDWRPRLSAGERGTALLLAPDQRQAGVALGYIEAIIGGSPVLRGQVESRAAGVLRLRGHVDIEVRATNFRRLRGVTAVLVLLDESAFLMPDETSENGDAEILNAVRPSLATTNGQLVAISSPYAKRGETYETWRRHFGPEGDPAILVAHGASRDFNQTLPQRVVDRALERDPASAQSEYLGLFRDDIADFIGRDTVAACIVAGTVERPPQPGVTYCGFVDMSGGISDSAGAAVAHVGADGRVTLDALLEVPAPHSPEAATARIVELLRRYSVRTVTGDRFAGAWPSEAFLRHGIGYRPAELARTGLYLSLLPRLTSRSVDLLDNPKLVQQLCGLERRTTPTGDKIDHRAGAHDDLSNAAAGAIHLAGQQAMRNACKPLFGTYAAQPDYTYRHGYRQ